MNNPQLRGIHFALARVTVEFDTAFHLGSGHGDLLEDALFTVDANGLPALPGDAIAGVLRHAWARGDDPHDRDSRCARIFGYQKNDEGETSRLEVSWGQVHNSKDMPVPFRAEDRELSGDPVLGALFAGMVRDHVRLDGTGTAAPAGKFDQTVVLAGTRFTFELRLDLGEGETSVEDMHELIALLDSRAVRLGRGGGRGLGVFRVRRAAMRVFDLRLAEDRDSYGQLPREIARGDGGQLYALQTREGDTPLHALLTLTPDATWRFGGTVRSGREPRDKRPARGGASEGEYAELDTFALTEPRIRWNEHGHGYVEPREKAPFLVPGSALRGALRHRAVFHANVLNERFLPTDKGWATETETDCPDAHHDPPAEVKALFGAGRGQEQGGPGAVATADAWVESAEQQMQQHVSLDRFTQGAMDGLLFSEAAVFGGALTLRLDVRRPASCCSTTRKVLARTLDDLCAGRLPLGAAGTRGHGRFTGSITWSDGGQWIQGQEVES